MIARRVGLAFTSIVLLATPALLGAPARAAAPAPTAAVVSAGALPCVTGTPAARGRFGHDALDVSAAVKERVQRDVLAQTRTLRARSTARGAATLPAQIRVPVVIHVIRGTHKRDRRITRAQARRLFYTLRAGFNGRQDPSMAPTGIIFEFNRITVTRNDRWFHARPSSKADRQMKRKLHRGKRRVLNVYLNNVQDGNGTLLGYARFPWQVGAHPKLDGVTINVNSLPGGKARGYNLGDTVIHETGHWLGLLHTFEGGCEYPGDYVNDTPAEGQPSFRCDKASDTCPTPLPPGWVEGDPEPEPVADPVQNFMDYSYDSCMNHFTPDQRTRAVTLFLRYRYGR